MDIGNAFRRFEPKSDEDPILELNARLFRYIVDAWDPWSTATVEIFKNATTGTSTLKITDARDLIVRANHFIYPDMETEIKSKMITWEGVAKMHAEKPKLTKFGIIVRPDETKEFQEAIAKAKDSNEASIKAGNDDVPKVRYLRDIS